MGTERRPPPAWAELTAALPSDTSPERVALFSAALSGAQRRAGVRALNVEVPPSADQGPEVESNPPHAAVQLLELLLAGNLGKPAVAQPLLQHWFLQCAHSGAVVPHELLVKVLDQATDQPELQPQVTSLLGQRGVWLGSQRERWAWAAERVDGTDVGLITAPRGDEEPETFAVLSADERDGVLRRLRAADPAAGRRLVLAVLSGLDAASRARLVRALAVGLGPDDEDLLEAALDDRSKSVRNAAIALLDGLAGSARAARLAGQLDGLTSQTGRLRPTLTVSFPAPIEGEQLRDLPSDGGRHSRIEAAWLVTMVAGAPLAWWEQRLAQGPEQILGGRFEPPAELLDGWTRAAVAEGNVAWARALLPHRISRDLICLSGDVPPAVLAEHLRDDGGATGRSDLLAALPPPWTSAISTVVVRWLRRHRHLGAVIGSYESILVAGLNVDAVPALESWLARIDKTKEPSVHRSLRHVIHLISTRTSITEAFS